MPALNKMDFFPVGTSEGARLRSPSENYQRYRGKTSNSSGKGLCQHAKACTTECRSAHGVWLETDEGRLGRVVTTRRPFDTLRHLTVTRILKTKHHRTYVVQYFRLAFQQGITL